VTDYVWPTDLAPSASEWRLVANTAAFASPLSGTTRTLARGGDRWACSMQFNNLTEAKRGRLQAFLARLRGQANRVWLWDHAYRQRGSFPTGEMLPNVGFVSTTGWTVSYGTQAAVDSVLRMTVAAHIAGQFPQTVSAHSALTSGLAYVARGGFHSASNTAVTFGLSFGVTSSYPTSYATTEGLRTVAGVSDGTAGGFFAVYDDDSVESNQFDLTYASVARCAQVKGAGQSGTSITVDGLGAGVSGALLAGDLVQIGNDLLMLTAPVTTYGDTSAFLRFNRPLSASPADNAAVIIHQPMARMILGNQTVGWSNQPGGWIGAVSSMTVEFVEDLA